jgi:hypothetical protein
MKVEKNKLFYITVYLLELIIQIRFFENQIIQNLASLGEIFLW